jgi:hypothetical protein
MTFDKVKAKELAKAKREQLKSLSKMAKVLVSSGQYHSINDALLNYYRQEIGEGDICFYTFDQWEEQGYHVAKGSKAWMIWGKPRPLITDKPVEAGQEPDTFFPVCYLFDNSQVIKRPEVEPKTKSA